MKQRCCCCAAEEGTRHHNRCLYFEYKGLPENVDPEYNMVFALYDAQAYEVWLATRDNESRWGL